MCLIGKRKIKNPVLTNDIIIFQEIFKYMLTQIGCDTKLFLNENKHTHTHIFVWSTSASILPHASASILQVVLILPCQCNEDVFPGKQISQDKFRFIWVVLCTMTELLISIKRSRIISKVWKERRVYTLNIYYDIKSLYVLSFDQS